MAGGSSAACRSCVLGSYQRPKRCAFEKSLGLPKAVAGCCDGEVGISERKEGSIMKVAEVQERIRKLKQENDVCILAHAYQGQEILEVADYVGDSYGLSVLASKAPNKTVIMCGVRFMAETCKVLCPQKTVYLANPLAGCPMADEIDLDLLERLKAEHPGYATVAYINTTSALKTACDVCVTSSSAVQICKALEADKILFVPDPNLGSYVASQVPEKQFAFFDGGCPHHKAMTEADVLEAKAAHPNALLAVHPECPAEVVKHADFVGSTTAIMSFAKESEAREFIVGTEVSIVEHLQFDCPEKSFYPLSTRLTCNDMKATTLMDVLGCLQGTAGEAIELPADVMEGAGRCIRRMIELGD